MPGILFGNAEECYTADGLRDRSEKPGEEAPPVLPKREGQCCFVPDLQQIARTVADNSNIDDSPKFHYPPLLKKN
ncbi:MAG: hypothetical protein ACXWWC_12935 [Chitinophagaceae bacterium]